MIGMAVVVGTVLASVGMGMHLPLPIVRVRVIVLVGMNDLSMDMLMGMDVLTCVGVKVDMLVVPFHDSDLREVT